MKVSGIVATRINRLPKGYVFTYVDVSDDVEMKEAVIKALALGDTGLDWRDIEVVRSEDGGCSIALHGAAAAALATRGADRVLVSLSHDADYAAAVVAVLSDTESGRV